MYTRSIAEILDKASKLKTVQEKVDWLRQNDTQVLRNILILTYDKNKVILLPDEAPPYSPSTSDENHGMLLNQGRKLRYFVEGFSPPDVKQIKREQIFIEMLESVHREDAKVLVQMIQRKPFAGLTKKTINEAFGEIIKDG